MEVGKCQQNPLNFRMHWFARPTVLLRPWWQFTRKHAVRPAASSGALASLLRQSTPFVAMKKSKQRCRNGRVVPATLAGRDPSTDLAVLKCPDAGAASAERGDAAAIKPGSITLVVGRTRASGPVAALGVVSLVVSERQTWSGSSLVPYVRLDVSRQPTAVGGAVADAQGKVLGI